VAATTEVGQANTVSELQSHAEKTGGRLVGIKREMLLVEELLGVAMGEVTRLGNELEANAGRVPDRMRDCDDTLIGSGDHESERHVCAELVSRRTEPWRRAVPVAPSGRILARRGPEDV
jgi:hypothetical protein